MRYVIVKDWRIFTEKALQKFLEAFAEMTVQDATPRSHTFILRALQASHPVLVL